MDSRRNVEEEKMVAELYEASRNGCVSTLTTLIQRDARFLDRVSLTSFSETPMHLAALHGHLEFSKLLLSKKPTLAKEVDSLGRTPLHLASAEGHTEIVKALLQANIAVCLASDQHERIPLHFAVMRGRIEIIEELIRAQPKSIQKNLNGGSVLHLCVQYNHLDALELLVKLADCDDLLNYKDRDGNSILHLAVILKQMKAIKYLLSIPEIKREANAMNMIGYSALDVLEACDVYPRDFKCFEIENILKEAGVKRAKDLNSSLPVLPLPPSRPGVDEAQAQSGFKRCWGSICSSLGKRLKHQGDWMKETRGSLMVVATVMATMAFQAGISPPGGVWQQNTSDSTDGFCGGKYGNCTAGTAVLSYYDPNGYLLFLYFNTASFFASLCVILLVVIEFPIRSKIFMWLLTLAMLASVASMTLTYVKVVVMLTSSYVYKKCRSLAFKLLFIWVGLVGVAVVIHIIRLLYWMVNKLYWMVKMSIHLILLLIDWMLKMFRKKSPAEDQANV